MARPSICPLLMGAFALEIESGTGSAAAVTDTSDDVDRIRTSVRFIGGHPTWMPFIGQWPGRRGFVPGFTSCF
ncbi:MAG: hypothetical protein ACREAA_16680 [Candidatus Polarisedimenticolia bacterium]